MTHFDLTPLYKTTIGFDRFAELLDGMAGITRDVPSYPPYNIELLDENEYRLTMAVAGFDRDELSIEVKENVLTVTGSKKETREEQNFLHRGIATRDFERRFNLADHVEVVGAALENGLLHVDLKRELPEAMKPRKIAINTAKPRAQVIEDKVADGKAAA